MSVCIPAYQSAWSLEATVRSVLEQDHDELEVVVVDNASTDETAAVLASLADPRLRVVTKRVNVPMAASWRAAVEATRGEHVKLLCADDVLLLGAVAAQSRLLDEHPTSRSSPAAGRSSTTGAPSSRRPGGLEPWQGLTPAEDVIHRYARNGSNIIGEPVCTMFRRAGHDAVGGFDEAASYTPRHRPVVAAAVAR